MCAHAWSANPSRSRPKILLSVQRKQRNSDQIYWFIIFSIFFISSFLCALLYEFRCLYNKMGSHPLHLYLLLIPSASEFELRSAQFLSQLFWESKADVSSFFSFNRIPQILFFSWEDTPTPSSGRFLNYRYIWFYKTYAIGFIKLNKWSFLTMSLIAT